VRIAVLCNSGSWYLTDLQRAASRRGHECRGVRFPQLLASISTAESRETVGDAAGELDGVDAVIVRTMPPGSLEQVVFRMNALARLEQLGVHLLNPPRSIECAVDKYLTTAKLHTAGVPVPETIVCEGSDEAMRAFDRLGGDVVVKPIFGAEGRGILRVDDPELALRTFRTIERLQAVLYLQEFIDHGGFDDRVLLLEGEVIGGMRRRAREDFRTNISQHGLAEAWSPDDRDIGLARRAATATGAVLAGVDLITDAEGRRMVLEINAVPGWRALARVNSIDVADRLITWIEAHAGGAARATG
jgi:ribosomal protein S6--L-glutamate ligase